MNPQCARCGKVVYPTEKVNCLDKVSEEAPGCTCSEKFWHLGWKEKSGSVRVCARLCVLAPGEGTRSKTPAGGPESTLGDRDVGTGRGFCRGAGGGRAAAEGAWRCAARAGPPGAVRPTARLPPPLRPLTAPHAHLRDPPGSPPHPRPSASREGGEVERRIVINMSWGGRCRIAKNKPRRRARAERGEPDPLGANPPAWGIPEEVALDRPLQPCFPALPGRGWS